MAVAAGSPVENELLHGERVLWVGRPDPRKRFVRGDIVLIPFSIVWTAGWVGACIAMPLQGQWGALIVGVPGAILGAYLTFGRFPHKAWRRRHTGYAVTDQRVLSVFESSRKREARAIFLDRVPQMQLFIRRDGSGSVTFGAASLEADGLEDAEGEGVGFYDIPDARYVVELVESLRLRVPDDVYASA